ncbi:MAG: TolC family protein [Vicinamibacterales bacterium]
MMPFSRLRGSAIPRMGSAVRGGLILLAVSCASIVTASAQTTLTLDDAVRTALGRNRTLLSARSHAVEADSRVDEARAGLLPSITVSESWRRGNQPVFVFSSLLSARQFAATNFAIDALNHPDPQGFFQTAVGIDQLLFDGGRVRSLVRAASLQRDLARTSADEAAGQTVLAVTQAYGQLLAAQAARRAADAGLAAARDDLTRARQRRDAGMVTEADVLSLAVHASDLEQRVIQADGDAAVARAELNRAMGEPPDREYDVSEPAEALVGDDVPPLPALLQDAETRRPALRRAMLAEELSQTLRRQARTALLPQVAAQAAVEVSGTSVGDRASAWIVGGQVRWSFSAGGAERARLRAAAEAASRARIEREDARNAVEVEILSARRRLEAARARRTVGQAAVDQARESQRIVRDRFDAGLATVTDVLRASTALLDAEARRTGALVDALVSRAALDKATGRLAATQSTAAQTNE